MALLTNSATFTVGAASLEFVEVTVTVLPPAPSALGKGRLIHPTYGTLDYSYPPTEWTNLDTDVIAPPTWASSKTLLGSSNTLWPGDIRDVTCTEIWNGDRGGLRMPIGQFRTLLMMVLDPPDPAVARVQWWPSYATALGYEVYLQGFSVGGQGVTLNWLSRAEQYMEGTEGWVALNDAVLTLKIAGRVEAPV